MIEGPRCERKKTNEGHHYVCQLPLGHSGEHRDNRDPMDQCHWQDKARAS